ncbi:MAG: maltose ABC transporter substrate-binding protein, partial [Anaerolineae bacterium]|nr:maltose ABC transporter substrate-binding protein [Anaerolineae bacterium]
PAAGGAAAKPAAKGAKLVFWTNQNPEQSKTEYDALKAQIDKWASQTGNTVEVNFITDYQQKLPIAAPAGQGPDAMGPFPHDQMGEWAKIGIIEPYSEIKDAGQYIQAAQDAVKFDGKIQGMPIFIESVGLVCNTNLVKTPPKTMEELVQIAKTQTTGGKYGFVFPILEAYHMYSFITAQGGYVFKYDQGKYDEKNIGLNNDGAVKAITFLQSLVKDKLIPESILDHPTMHDAVTSLVEKGNVGCTINGPWILNGLKKANVPYSISRIPTWEGKTPQPFSGVQMFLVNSKSANKAAAADLVSFLANKDSAVALTKAFNKAPVRKDVLDDASLKDNTELKAWADQASVAVPMPNIPEMQQVWKPWSDATDAIIPGKAEAKSTMDQAVAQIKSNIEKARK